MASLSETIQYEPEIYQIKTTDAVVGGPDGISNRQAKELANRTAWLKQEVEQRAPTNSPALTGTPQAPTPAPGTNTDQIATTAFVIAVRDALVNGAPGLLDALNELANAIGNDPNYAATMATQLGLKAPLESPALTGTPTAPTAPAATDTTQLATTAFVQAALNSLAREVGGWTWALANPNSSVLLPLRGATYSRAAYPELWTYANDASLVVAEAAWSADYLKFSDGDGSSTFRVPDPRGLFMRILDEGRGIDTGRALGSVQADQNKEHEHRVDMVGQVGFDNTGGNFFVGADTNIGGSYPNTNMSMELNGGAEARPINFALPAFIRFA